MHIGIPRSLLFCLVLILASPIWAENHSRVLLYHQVSKSTPALTSIAPELFEQHLDYLETQGFSVVPLSSLLDSIRLGEELPESSIAISFDDAYQSVYEQAFPLLKARGMPFSVFVTSDAVDLGFGSVMSWSQLAELQEYGAEIGGHSTSHTHLVRQMAGETNDQWLRRVIAEVDGGNGRIEEELGNTVKLFAYPYGEYNDEIKALIGERGLYGLAQQSGAIGPLTDLRQIPRYPMAQSYADMDRFALIAQSKDLPAVDVKSGGLIRTAGEIGGELTFSLLLGDYQITQLACFSSNGQALSVSREGADVRVALPVFVTGRNKINCTAPSALESGVFYWFSQQWIAKQADGNWLAE